MTEIELINLLRNGGPSATMLAIAIFTYRVIWPYLRDTHLPAVAAARTKTAEAMQDIALLVKTLNQNITSLNTKVDQVFGELGDVQQDVAGLYGHIRAPRPSRNSKQVTETPKETKVNE